MIANKTEKRQAAPTKNSEKKATGVKAKVAKRPARKRWGKILRNFKELRKIVLLKAKQVEILKIASHPLSRFVTKETVAFLFGIKIQQIYRIECWERIVYVHAEGISKFVSYADFPPVMETQNLEEREFTYWRKRWAKKWKLKKAPEFWVQFYTQKFIESTNIKQLWDWGNLIAEFKFLFEEVDLQRLRENYAYQRHLIFTQQNWFSRLYLSGWMAKKEKVGSIYNLDCKY